MYMLMRANKLETALYRDCWLVWPHHDKVFQCIYIHVVCLQVFFYICTTICICSCMYTCIYVYVYMCSMHVYIHVCVCVYMCTCICHTCTCRCIVFTQCDVVIVIVTTCVHVYTCIPYLPFCAPPLLHCSLLRLACCRL